MPDANAMLRHRPLRGGIAVVNPLVNRLGTIGLIATDGTDLFAVSCYHVLGRLDRSPFWNAEPIHQPLNRGSVSLIGTSDPARADAAMDAAAARLHPSVPAVGEVLGIGTVAGTLLPAVGMRVVKMGAITGCTEGVVDACANGIARIVPVRDFPLDYVLTRVGDSGSVWVEPRSGFAVAMHRAGNPTGAEYSEAVAIDDVLRTLGLGLA